MLQADQRDPYQNTSNQNVPKTAIPLPSEQTISQVIGKAYDPDKTLNVVKMFAGTGDLFTATNGLTQAIFQAQDVDAKMRELIIVRTAKVTNCAYALQVGAVLAKNTGLSVQEVEAALGDDPVAGINPDYVLLCQAVDELAIQATLSDETLRQLQSRYDDTLCRKYVLMLSWFNLVNRFENGCRVPFEAPAKIAHMTLPVE